MVEAHLEFSKNIQQRDLIRLKTHKIDDVLDWSALFIIGNVQEREKSIQNININVSFFWSAKTLKSGEG